MTNEEFAENWREYGVEIAGKIIPIKEHYCIHWGWMEQYSGFMFDPGGEQGTETSILRVEDDNLVSVNPANTSETTILGKLVKL